MTLEEALNPSNGNMRTSFRQWFNERGFSNVTSKELEKFVENGYDVFFYCQGFQEIYFAKKIEENYAVIKKWTTIVGILMIFVMGLTVVQLWTDVH
jgi:hypothetical protein